MSLARVKWRRTSLARSLIPIPIPSRDRDPLEPGAPEPGASDPDADGGFPSTYSQIDPDVLEAIGEDERRRLRAHYDEEARRSREAPTRRGVVARKTANARAREDANRRRRRTVSRGCSPRNHIATERRRFA